MAEPTPLRGGLNCDFSTGRVQLAGTFDTPIQAITTLTGALRALERFGRAYAEGIRTEASYKIWAAAEQAPVKLAVPGVRG
jgi:hypothetical protein